ncbi:conserved oligomeric Golgi complex subunit 6 isoform X2 [Hydra vulgaris]|uniref:Conserved oligomeric Golgi complex subunit 6 n=1 Tax=Hydra vulgaris TaxID=6087 RepID=A0ABM4B7L7_HYDVU
MADIASDGNVSQSHLTKKLKRILDTRLESDKELLDALKALSSCFGENTLRARRDLRGDVEKRNLDACEKFEAQFREVKEKLDEISADINAMSSCCRDMTDRVKRSKESTAELIEKTTKLKVERKQIDLQSLLATSFIEHYQLKPNHIKVLRSSNDVTEEFFEALKRAKEIHSDCKLLLLSKQQTTGLEIMESMALYQETAYEKLYRWTQGECRNMTGDMPDVSGALCRAIEALQDRQVLLRYALDELGSARRSAVVRCFIDALTRGGPGSTPRPIELYSHDPVRYVGDILAWLHQAVAGEKELLHSLLRRTKINEHKILISDALNHIIDGVCRPFKVRIEQVITSEPGAPVLFRLTNLLKFYGTTLSGLFESNAALIVVTINEMMELSHQIFYSSLSMYGNKIADKIDIPPPDLSPSQPVIETLNLLKNVLSSHDSAISSLDERKDDYEKIYTTLLEPLLQCCVLNGKCLNMPDMSTYMLNCLYKMQVTLAVYEFSDLKIEMLLSQAAVHIETLTKEQANFILNRSGLGVIFNKINDISESNVLLSSQLDSSTISEAMASFDKYLSNPDSLNIPQMQLIHSTRIRDTICKQANDIVQAAYNKVYTEVTKNYSDILMTRTPEQLRLLLA